MLYYCTLVLQHPTAGYRIFSSHFLHPSSPCLLHETDFKLRTKLGRQSSKPVQTQYSLSCISRDSLATLLSYYSPGPPPGSIHAQLRLFYMSLSNTRHRTAPYGDVPFCAAVVAPGARLDHPVTKCIWHVHMSAAYWVLVPKASPRRRLSAVALSSKCLLMYPHRLSCLRIAGVHELPSVTISSCTPGLGRLSRGTSRSVAVLSVRPAVLCCTLTHDTVVTTREMQSFCSDPCKRAFVYSVDESQAFAFGHVQELRWVASPLPEYISF